MEIPSIVKEAYLVKVVVVAVVVVIVIVEEVRILVATSSRCRA